MDVEDEASRCAMEAADEIKEGGTKVMPTATPDPPETRGVEAMRTGKVDPPRNVGTVAKKATGRVSVGKSAPIRREPVPDLVPEMWTKETDSNRTTLKDPENRKRVCLRDETRSELNEANHPKVGRGVVC